MSPAAAVEHHHQNTAELLAVPRMANADNVEDLLNKLRIPAYPPDRSKWRKLEIAMKFIEKSKTSVEQSKKRRESLKIQPKELAKRDEENKVPTKWGKVKSSLHQIA